MWVTLDIDSNMAGPILSKLMQRFNVGRDEAERIRDDSPMLEEHREEIRERMAEEGGGCCGAMVAAKAVRSDEQEYR